MIEPVRLIYCAKGTADLTPTFVTGFLEMVELTVVSGLAHNCRGAFFQSISDNLHEAF
jgi:hypothetical protein